MATHPLGTENPNAQKTFETMAQYGSRRTCAEFLGKKVGRALLQETLDEECVTERNRQEALAISDPDGKF